MRTSTTGSINMQPIDYKEIQLKWVSNRWVQKKLRPPMTWSWTKLQTKSD